MNVTATPEKDKHSHALPTTWPARDNHPTITGGVDHHLEKPAHTGNGPVPEKTIGTGSGTGTGSGVMRP